MTNDAKDSSGGVLIVDDDLDVLSLLADLVASRLPELPVHIAMSAEEALGILRREEPAVIVSDYRMPGMDGVAFLHLARGQLPHARFIMMAGEPDRYAAQSAAEESYSLLTKPIQPELFIRLMQGLVGNGSA